MIKQKYSSPDVKFFEQKSQDYEKFKAYHRILRRLIILLNMLSLLFGYFELVPFGQVFKNFNFQCPLYSEIKLSASTLNQQQLNISFDPSRTIWSHQWNCQYLVLIGIFNICNCVLSITFFIMFNMKDLIKNDHCLLIPWILISTIFTFVVFIGASMFTHGFSVFCDSYKATIKDIRQIEGSCRSVQFSQWISIDTKNLFDYLMVSNISIWILFLNLILVDVVIFLRIMCVVKFVECQLHDQEVLLVRYYRILRKERVDRSYNISLPMKLKKSENNSFGGV